MEKISILNLLLCPNCKKDIKRQFPVFKIIGPSVKCSKCKQFYHKSCANISDKELDDIKMEKTDYTCINCKEISLKRKLQENNNNNNNEANKKNNRPKRIKYDMEGIKKEYAIKLEIMKNDEKSKYDAFQKLVVTEFPQTQIPPFDSDSSELTNNHLNVEPPSPIFNTVKDDLDDNSGNSFFTNITNQSNENFITNYIDDNDNENDINNLLNNLNK